MEGVPISKRGIQAGLRYGRGDKRLFKFGGSNCEPEAKQIV
jgi:hypothetical protein